MTPPRDQVKFSLRFLHYYTLAICAALGIGVNLPAIIRFAFERTYERWEVGDLYDQIVFKETAFDLRISAFHQRGKAFAKPGSFFRYEARTAQNQKWREIMTVLLPVDEPIPRNQFEIVNSNCAFFFNRRVMGITTNGGVAWSCISVQELPVFDLPQVSYLEISEVQINQDGIGEISVSCFGPWPEQTMTKRNVKTINFGQIWQEVR